MESWSLTWVSSRTEGDGELPRIGDPAREVARVPGRVALRDGVAEMTSSMEASRKRRVDVGGCAVRGIVTVFIEELVRDGFGI